jgi:oxaloacetate decarboxylase
VTSIEDALVRARAYQAVGVDALFFTGVKTRSELEVIAAATLLPIILGGLAEPMADFDYLSRQRVRIAVQGHAPIAAATKAVFDALRAIREGAVPKDLKHLASSELMDQVTRAATVKQRAADLLGLKR